MDKVWLRRGSWLLAGVIAAGLLAWAFAPRPAEVEITGARFGSSRVPADHALPRSLAAAAKAVTGRRPELTGVPYGADMRLFIGVGETPCVMFGPGDVRLAHAADERVARDSLERVHRSIGGLLRHGVGDGTERS